MIRTDNMQPAAAVFAGLTGTSFMTSFSYLIAKVQKENFKEPELLAMLLRRLIPELDKRFSRIAGWNIHYSVGVAFAIIYAALWENNKLRPSVKSGLLLGGISGLVAIATWGTAFMLLSPGKVKFKSYYGHLFVTHLVFGTFASLGYKMVRPNNR